MAVAPIQAVAAVPLATAAPAAAPRALPNAPAAGWSTTAIASIVTLVVGLTVVSIPLGHYALSQIKVTGQRGRGLAIASLVLGYPVFLFWTIIFISAFATAARNSS